MRAGAVVLFLIGQLVFAGCVVAVSPERKAYILAKPHGWIELTVTDSQVPAVPREKDERNFVEKPPLCTIEVRIDNEVLLSDYLFPFGEIPAYEIDSGFRFAVPVGPGNLTLEYGRCSLDEKGKLGPINAAMQVAIQEGYVTPVYFDGKSLLGGAITLNTKATLEEVNGRLINIESLIRKTPAGQ